jgi:hypothetical protein
MTIVVFLGPTLDRRTAESILPATYLPPVSLGDVYAVARERPWGIGIIDGAFDRVPAVWHKEILWAMSRGIHVFGSSSMGALRAAELHRFGMVGIGTVFEAFRDGALTDDDEVAIVHGPPERGYMPVSEAMVNLRATLAAARDNGCIGRATHDRLVAMAKATHYRDRTWSRILREAEAGELPTDELDALRNWLPDGRRHVKGSDARLLLKHMASARAEHPGPKTVTYRFHATTMWEELRRSVPRRPLVPDGPDGRDRMDSLDDPILEELRINPDAYRALRDRALVRMLALEIVEGEGGRAAVGRLHPDAASPEPGEEGPAAGEGHLTAAARARLVADDEHCARVRHRYGRNLPMYLRDELHSLGGFTTIAARARQKREFLARRGLGNPGCADAGLTEDELWSWYFREALGLEVPPDVDAWAAEHDFEDRSTLRRAVIRERIYRDCLPASAARGVTTPRPPAPDGIAHHA